MFHAFGLIKLYHAAQSTVQITLPQSLPFSRSLCTCVGSNLSSSIFPLRTTEVSGGLSARLLGPGTAHRAQIVNDALATQYRSVMMCFVVE